MQRARNIVRQLPEVTSGTADLSNSYAGYNTRGHDVWALVCGNDGEFHEYCGTTTTPMERTRISESVNVSSLILNRTKEGYVDLSTSTPFTPFTPTTYAGTSRRSRQRAKRNGSKRKQHKRQSGSKTRVRRNSGGNKGSGRNK